MVEYDVARAIQADRRAKALSASYVSPQTRTWGSWFTNLFTKTEVAVPNQEWAPEHKVGLGQYR